MKVVKPVKCPVLTRVVERDRQPSMHVANMLAFSMQDARSLIDEISFWPVAVAALGETGVLDDGISKARGEVLVGGSFHAPGGEPIAASFVRLTCGKLDKRIAVLGDRHWNDGVPTDPEPMTTMPIDWAHAYGGEGYDKNPWGKGAREIEVDGDKLRPLPNVEHYGRLIRSPSDKPEPAGLMAMDVTFAQRRARAGSYDRAWFEHHFPGMAPDMDPNFFNVGPDDQWADGFLQGDETFAVENMHPDKPRIEGALPGLVTRSFVTQRTADGERFVEIPMRCDTLWLFPGAELGVAIFHGAIAVADDTAADIVHLVAACEDPQQPRDIEHYQEALCRRLDKDIGAIVALADGDLMPPVESGVAANIGELDEGRWTKGENLQAKRVRRGNERRVAQARAEVEAEGLDPATFGLAALPPQEEPPPVDDLQALSEYALDKKERADAEIKQLEKMREEAEERARAEFAELGKDFDATMAADAQAATGPPEFSAAEHLQLMLDNLETAREGGAPLEALEEQVADPDYQAGLIRIEEQLREMYRNFGHMRPAAAAMDGEASERARVMVQAAIDTDTVLAGRDFTGADLSGMSLRGLDLSGCYLEATNLAGCDLGEAVLDAAVLAHANLEGAKLEGAVICGANLGSANLRGAILEGADLSEAVLARADLTGAKLAGATLEGADMVETKLVETDLSGASLPKAALMKAELARARFVAADLSQATFVECRLAGVDMSRAQLHKSTFVMCAGDGAVFHKAKMAQSVLVHESSFREADFSDAELEKANLRGTELTGANFDRAQLAGADLSECDITGGSLERAELMGAVMIHTKLDRASLQGANLMDALVSKASLLGADMTGANLFQADLSRARGDSATTLAGAEVGRVRYLPKADGEPLPTTEETP